MLKDTYDVANSCDHIDNFIDLLATHGRYDMIDMIESLERDAEIQEAWRCEKQKRCKNRKNRFKHSRSFKGTYTMQEIRHSDRYYNREMRDKLREKDRKVSMADELQDYFYEKAEQREIARQIDAEWAKYELCKFRDEWVIQRRIRQYYRIKEHWDSKLRYLRESDASLAAEMYWKEEEEKMIEFILDKFFP